MKYQLRKFAIISNRYNVENFYNIEVTSGRITMMGKFSSDIALECKRCLGEGTVDRNGFLFFLKNDVKIVLT